MGSSWGDVAPTKGKQMTYIVTIKNIDIAWERPGVVEIKARTKAEAISIARRMVRDGGHDRHSGRMTYEAQPA